MRIRRLGQCGRAGLVVILAVTAACGGDDEGSGADRVGVIASFYPLAFAVEQVGGERVDVEDLTPAGAEPHDLELSPAQVDAMLDADVAVVLGAGFQPAVERTAGQRDGGTVEVLAGDDERDPHVWLDPVRMAEIADALGRALSRADPAGRAAYRRNLRRFREELADLDARFAARLTGCERDLLVTSHEAFGHLARRYELRQEGVAGIAPHEEPDARRLAELADLARDQGVTTVFTEEAVSSRIAETLAREAGGLRTEVLSPLETLDDRARADGDDYFSVMGSNLDKIAAALGCPPS